MAVYCYKLDQADRRPGEEHGSAHWGSVRQLNAKYQNRKDKRYDEAEAASFFKAPITQPMADKELVDPLDMIED